MLGEGKFSLVCTTVHNSISMNVQTKYEKKTCLGLFAPFTECTIALYFSINTIVLELQVVCTPLPCIQFRREQKKKRVHLSF